jgi:hypothetical protein
MDGSAVGATDGHDALGRFTRGHSEYAAKRRRVEQRLAELSADFDADCPSMRMLLLLAAQHLDEATMTRSAEKRVRATNTANRLLRQIPRKKAPEPPTLGEILRGLR